ncbi:MAG: hypothetical protein ACFFGZ_02120 [Candidatus Thorarchaeota archaeon]
MSDEANYYNIMVKVLKTQFDAIGADKLNDAIAKGLDLFLQAKGDEQKSVDVLATIDSMMGLAKISKIGNHSCSGCQQLLTFTADRTQIQLEDPDRRAKKTKSHPYTVALTFSCSNCGPKQVVADSTVYVPIIL